MGHMRPLLCLLLLQLGEAAAAAAVAPVAGGSSHGIVGRTFEHRNAGQRVAYGIQLPEGRAPLAFAEAIAEDVTNYIREDPLGPFVACEEPDLGSAHWSGWGFSRGGPEPILKADWHASSFWADGAKVFVPRLDAPASLRRAPPRVLAFVEAFRQANSPCWHRVAQVLDDLGREAEEKEEWELVHLVGIFRRGLENRAHFGALEAQVWDGGHLIMQSHTDGATAMLHLGLTLGGCRTLRVGKFPEQHSPYKDQATRRRGKPPGDEVSVWNREAYDNEDLWDVRLDDGSAYLSLPFCFEHGVRYESGTGELVIALQCRFAFANESEAMEVNGQRTNNMRRIAEVVANAIADAVDHRELRMPSLEEVMAMEAHVLVALGQAPASAAAGAAPTAATALPYRPGPRRGDHHGLSGMARAAVAATVAGATAALCGWSASAAWRGGSARAREHRLAVVGLAIDSKGSPRQSRRG